MKYKHVFFDLDHTLWDFEKNSAETLRVLFAQFNLHDLGIKDSEEFLKHYHHYNEIYWDFYRNGKVTREELRTKRFEETLKDFGIENEELVKDLSVHYLEILPTKTNLFDDTLEILDYLYPKYALHII